MLRADAASGIVSVGRDLIESFQVIFCDIHFSSSAWCDVLVYSVKHAKS